MIISDNRSAEIYQFEKICKNAEEYMNIKAVQEPRYYLSKGAQKLEPEVFKALEYVSKGTSFEGSIRIESGLRFPDIVLRKYYGVEVKSTTKNQWSVIGGSVAEGTRIEDVELIFLMFGKLHDPVEFKTRRYQDCLSDIAVTHSPRYKIDMNLSPGNTIFDKMDIAYDDLRLRRDPIKPVVEYYKRQLKEGESLWWIGDNAEEESSPMKIRLWNTLSNCEKETLKIQGFALFPCIFQKNNHKFDKLSLWLAYRHGVVSSSLRDNFSAGGQINMTINGHYYNNVPRIYCNLKKVFSEVVAVIYLTDLDVLKETWGIELSGQENLIDIWMNLVLRYAGNEDFGLVTFLEDINNNVIF